jgi:hypothetical protein
VADETPKQDQDLDAPTPPGGPLRQDAPGPGAHHGGDEAPRRPGDAAPDAGDDATDESADEPDTHPGDRDLQQENAETSLDQPSQ